MVTSRSSMFVACHSLVCLFTHTVQQRKKTKGSCLFLIQTSFDFSPVFLMVAEDAKVSFMGHGLCLQCFHRALISCWTRAQCCERSLIRAESLWGQGPLRTWAAPSLARKIITSIRIAGSDKDHRLRITGSNLSYPLTCWYQMAVYTDWELRLRKLCYT